MSIHSLGKRAVGPRFNDALSQIAWQDFEVLIANYYREQGFDVEHCGTGGTGSRHDGGVDLRLRKDSQLVLVQCKHENANQVEHHTVHQLIDVMGVEGATGAIVITSGEFTAEALLAGGEGRAQLVDGVELRRLLGARLDTLPTPSRLNAPEPGRHAQPILVKEKTRHSRSWSRRRDTPNVLLAKGLFGLTLAAALVFLAPSAISKFFPTLLPNAPAAAEGSAAASTTEELALPTPEKSR